MDESNVLMPLIDAIADKVAQRVHIPGNEDKLTWTVREATAKLGLSENTIYESLKTGELPGFKIGGSWRISVPALMDKLHNPELFGNGY